MINITAWNRTTGLFHKDYSSILEAANDLKLDPSGLSRCLSGEQVYAGNYTFSRTKLKEELANDSINI